MATQHSLFLDNGALGDKETPFHLRKLCDELANIIERNEEKVQLDWDVPTYPKARKRFEQMLEEEGDDVSDATGDGYGDPVGDSYGDLVGDATGDPIRDPTGDPTGGARAERV